MSKSKYNNPIATVIIFFSLTTVVAASYLYVEEKRKVQLKDLVEYHTKMIKSGSISSLVTLGKMYEKGEGVKKDLSKAKELFNKAINYNQYIDEIYPSYSEQETEKEYEEDINYSYNEESNKNKSQIKNILFNVEAVEKEQKVTSVNKKITKPKYVPYKKSNTKKQRTVKTQSNTVFSAVVVIKGNNKTASTKTKKLNTAIVLRESSSKKVIKFKKSKNSKKYRIKVKPKTAKKIKNKKPRYKKTIVFKKRPAKNNITQSKTRKSKLQAKRSPTLYEERTDYETGLGIFDENQNEYDQSDSDLEDDEIISVKKEIENKNSIGTNFTTNPCSTASARYIAKCRRINKEK